MQAIASPVRRTAFKAILGGFAAFTGYSAFYQFQNYRNKTEYFGKVQEDLTRFSPVEIKDQDAVIYPWLRVN